MKGLVCHSFDTEDPSFVKTVRKRIENVFERYAFGVSYNFLEQYIAVCDMRVTLVNIF